MIALKGSDLPIPGSVLLVDVNGDSSALHAHGEKSSDVVLLPTPSNDVNDPLNWSIARKRLHFACLLLYTCTAGIGLTALYSVLVPISQDTGISLATLNAGTGYMFLLLGWGGLITQPLALTFGKRGMYLVSQLANIGCIIWMAYIGTSSSWLANKVVQGFVVSPIEMLVEVSISDMFFAHERGLYIGLYALMLFGSNYIAPIIAGFINDALGYRSVFYISAGIQAFGLLISFFFMEETNYVRKTSERVDALAEVDDSSFSGEKSKLPSATTSDVLEVGKRNLEGVPRTIVQRLSFFNHSYTSLGLVWTMCYRPIILVFRFPVIFWAGFQYGSALVWYNVLNATSSSIFSASPYDFRASAVGLTYFGPLVGVCIGGIYSGWFGDKFALWFARRKNGIREPEDRLWLMGLCVILCPASLILWGVGASQGIHWIGLVFGGGMLAASSSIAASLTISYALDCYKDLAGEAMISIILVRNSLSFAIGYGITPWLNLGLRDTFISAAFVGMAINASYLIVIKFGKGWRSSSRALYWGFVETSAVGGH